MQSANDPDKLFLEKLSKTVGDNLTNEQFGVEELGRIIGMSRSQLHRKIRSITGQSVSQFVREFRLQRGMALLKERHLTAAEVADQIGFGSPTYFNKCFSEFYGFPPGEVKNRMVSDPASLEPFRSEPVNPTRNGSAGTLIPTYVTAGVIVLIAGLLLLFEFRSKVALPPNADKSIAILPFRNLSEEASNEYFSEGVIEAIRTTLTQIGDLRVISRTSVEQYRQSSKSARDIARDLGVSALLEGSVQRDKDKVRIDVRLIDGVTEGQVWAESYDRELKDVLAIQSEIAQHVASELNAKLSFEERTKLSKTDTDNPRAYDLYLKALYEYRTYTNEGAHNAINMLTEAIALDSNYARAYAFLANSYVGLATIWGVELSPSEAFQKAKPLIEKALTLDSHLDEAHMLMGFYKLYNDWDFAGADMEYKLAIASGQPDALALYSDFLNFVGRHKEALEMAERLKAKDPYYPNSRLVQCYYYNGMLDEALQFSDARLKLFKNYITLDAHGFLMLNTGHYKDAITFFNKTIALEGIRYPRMLGWMGVAYARLGERKKAMQLIDELRARLAKKEPTSISFFIAVIYAALDDRQSAISWLKSAYRAHDMEMPWLMTEPEFIKLHQDRGFQELAKQMGFDKWFPL